uniref:Villin headpiece; Gelsolin region n=1 Tax=Solanum tuberosum TaxID=4113 RepID=M0ZZK3_SOLTU
MCANFVNYGTPDPIPGAPCCDTFLMQIVPTHEEGCKLQIAFMLHGLTSSLICQICQLEGLILSPLFWIVRFTVATSASKTGALRHDIHYCLGEDTSQDEAGVAAIKTVELYAALGGRAVQYREKQRHETKKFLSYFKPCIIPLKGGISSMGVTT